MNLLLLLSALLSAFSSVGGGVRATGIAQSVAASRIETRVAPASRRVATARPVARPLLLAVVAEAAIRGPAPLFRIAPIWTSRRRE